MTAEYPARLFVYGTLRRDPRHEMFHVLAKRARFLSDAQVPGRLYDLGAYPGMARTSAGQYVRGEIYEVDPKYWSQVIQQLDEYEGCTDSDPKPHEYRRELVEAELPSGQKVDVWAYVLNRSARGLREISSGDYLSKTATGGAHK